MGKNKGLSMICRPFVVIKRVRANHAAVLRLMLWSGLLVQMTIPILHDEAFKSRWMSYALFFVACLGWIEGIVRFTF